MIKTFKLFSSYLMLAAVGMFLIPAHGALAEGSYTWTEQTGSGARAWSHVTVSADGTKLIGSVYGASIAGSSNYMYISTDRGVTWNPVTAAGSRDWYWVSASSDFKYLLGSDHGGYLYLSTDSGVTWNPVTSAGTGNWWPSVISSDGTKMAAGDGTNVYYSLNGGSTWTATASPNVGATLYMTASPDLSHIAAAGAGSQKTIFTSSDYGATWTNQTGAYLAQNGFSDSGYSGVSISADGTKLAGSLYFGPTYFSTDSGVTWARSNSGGGIQGRGIAASADGSIVAIQGWTQGLAISTDYGNNYTTQTSAGTSRQWYSISSSASGLLIAASNYAGYIYTASAPDIISPTVSFDTPANASVVEGSSVSLSVTASDNVAVSGVQFMLDGVTNIGSEVTSSPYTVSWNSAEVSEGSHTLYAVVRDASNNYSTSTISVTVTHPSGGFSTTYVTEGNTTYSIQGGVKKVFSVSPVNDLWFQDYQKRSGTSPAAATATSATAEAASSTSTLDADAAQAASGLGAHDVAAQNVAELPDFSFTKDLSFGMADPEVLALQRYLNSHGFAVSVTGAGSPGSETPYFGKSTRNAVVRFQKANGITPAAGYFGPITRGVLAGR